MLRDIAQGLQGGRRQVHEDVPGQLLGSSTDQATGHGEAEVGAGMPSAPGAQVLNQLGGAARGALKGAGLQQVQGLDGLGAHTVTGHAALREGGDQGGQNAVVNHPPGVAQAHEPGGQAGGVALLLAAARVLGVELAGAVHEPAQRESVNAPQAEVVGDR